MDARVQETAAAMDMSTAWNGGITDFPSWEVQDEVGKGHGYIGFVAGAWEIEVMVDSSSLTLHAKDMNGALLMVRLWGGRFADVDEDLETLRNERGEAVKYLAWARYRAQQALAVEEFDGNDDEINVLRLALTEISDAGRKA